MEKKVPDGKVPDGKVKVKPQDLKEEDIIKDRWRTRTYDALSMIRNFLWYYRKKDGETQELVTEGVIKIKWRKKLIYEEYKML